MSLVVHLENRQRGPDKLSRRMSPEGKAPNEKAQLLASSILILGLIAGVLQLISAALVRYDLKGCL